MARLAGWTPIWQWRKSGVIVDTLLLYQQKCIDDTTFAVQIDSIFPHYKFVQKICV